MSWARLDDGFAEHPKIKRAWKRHPRAVGLFAMAISHAARYETDGAVDDDWLEEKLPGRQERDKVIGVLVDAGLFERDDDGALNVHDFLDYNRSGERATEERAKTAERQRRFQDRRRNGTPDPTRPDPSPPTPPKGGRPRKRGRRNGTPSQAPTRDWVRQNVPELPEREAIDIVAAAWNARQEITPEQVRERVAAA